MNILNRLLKRNSEPPSLDVQFFARFVGAVGYLNQVFGAASIEYGLPSLVEEVEPGTKFVMAKRKWHITGILVEDVATIIMSGSIFLDCEIGHTADYSMMVSFGWTHEKSGPIIMAYWIGQMVKFEPPEEYYLTRGGPEKFEKNGTYPYRN